MQIRALLAAIFLLSCYSARAQESAKPLSTAHDGQWSVVLTCPDTADKRGKVKGYDYSFSAAIAGGRLTGHYKAVGESGSITYTGTVLPDGALEITAAGHTGKREYAVGGVAEGTPYTYTLQGKLSQASGQANRKEVRPCTAVLTRQ